MAFALNVELFHVIFNNLSYIKVWIIIVILPFFALLPDIANILIQRLVFPNPSDILISNVEAVKKQICQKPVQKQDTIRKTSTIRKEIPIGSQIEMKVTNKFENELMSEIKMKPNYSQLSDTFRPILDSPGKNDYSNIEILDKDINEEIEKETKRQVNIGDENTLNHLKLEGKLYYYRRI
jgi:hypothetical protein